MWTSPSFFLIVFMKMSLRLQFAKILDFLSNFSIKARIIQTFYVVGSWEPMNGHFSHLKKYSSLADPEVQMHYN